jgi:hypothetical protein
MSLFDEASLIVTPNAYKEGKIFAIKPTDGSGDLSVVRATTATDVNSLGLIETVSANVPRLDYTNATCPSILVEPQRTNLATFSEDFTNSSWDKITSGASVSIPIVTANSAISPDGRMNADLIEFTPPSNVDFSICRKSIFFNNSLSGSIYLKAFDESQVGKKVGIYIVRIGDVQGTVLTLTNEWQRVIISRPNDAYVEFTFGKGRTIWTTGGITQSESASKFYAWGAQLELGSNATSYIPTVASTVTRNADVISKTGISDLIGQTEGTIFVDFNYTKATDVYRRIFAISDNTSNNLISINLTATGSVEIYIINGGVTQVAFVANTLTLNTTYKIAVGYIANNAVLYINGTLRNTDLSCTIPTCSGVYLGKVETAGSTAFLNDTINTAMLFKTKLTNSELATLTTP